MNFVPSTIDLIIVGTAGWLYMTRVAIRWDKHIGSPAALPTAWLIFFWPAIVVGALEKKNLPSSPWSILDPPTVISAEERSLEMERETGLVFDGKLLQPGYETPNTLEPRNYASRQSSLLRFCDL